MSVRARSVVAGAVLVAMTSLARIAMTSLALVGCANDNGSIRGAGTIEMDEIDVASLVGGRVLRMNVVEGDSVQAGDTLAVLTRGEIAAELAAQSAEADRAQSQARDLAQGARPAELRIASDALREAEAEQRLAQSTYDRTEKLAQGGVVPATDLERARAAKDAADARVSSAREALRLQDSGFRRQQVAAARQGASAAQAQLAGARSRANELVLTAPRSGVVLLVNYQTGELVSPSSPVVTLGDPDSLWMRVYVAAPKLTHVRLGAPVEVRPIGAKRTFAGRVVSIARQAEFTPRAALTEEEQANLVFGVKLALARSGGALKAGLPADARIQSSP